jgi:hypothetical protein
MNIYIEPGKNFTEEIKYVWGIFSKGKNTVFVNNKNEAEFVIDSSPDSHLPVATIFYNEIEKGNYAFTSFLSNDLYVKDSSGKNDYIATAFYMLNSLQEYDKKQGTDEIGRFRYEDSYQYKFGCIQQNIVQECFDKLINESPILSGFKSASVKSFFFLSHDIDTVHGALMQDGLYLAKKFKPLPALKIMMNAIIQNPDWLNMDKIMKIEDEYSFKSTFFWLVNKGKVNAREVNSDYDIQSSKIKSVIKQISNNKWENGLHKSISKESLKEEISKSGENFVANRYHYLKYSLPEMYDAIEESGLKMDASLGFAESYGFRNNYGMPFKPFNMAKKKTYSFIEVPLHIMDGTFQRYLKAPKEKTADLIIDFLEKNKYNCLLSILWHNTFFTPYKYNGYLDIYKKVLSYLYENKFDCINQSEIIERFS